MSTPRRFLAASTLALLVACSLSAPAHAIYLEQADGPVSTWSSLFRGFFGFLDSIFAAGNGDVFP